MSEQESDVLLFHSPNSNIQTKVQRTKIFLELLSNGSISVDWSDLPKHRKTRQCVIHCKSLNNNQSQALRVSRKERNTILRKIEAGHLYEIHVCTIDSRGRIMASSERAQIQTKPSNEAPILRVVESTPDFICLKWEKSEDVQLSDVESYKLIVNGQTKALLSTTEEKFIVSDGQLGQRYVFQLEMSRKNGKMISSLPISIIWPGVTLPKHHAYVNGGQEILVCWGNSTSINDGNIESYTLQLYDSEGCSLNEYGPHPSECRQVWIKDSTQGVYFYVLEMKLANSKKSLFTKPMKIECGSESRAPILTCDYTDSSNQKQVTNMAHHLINIRDNMKSKGLLRECEDQLIQTLSTLASLTDSTRLTLTVESRSSDKFSKDHELIIDDQETPIVIPWFTKEFPLELRRKDTPYELAVSETPGLYQTKSKKVLVDVSGQFSFFCLHFHQQRSIKNCSYMETFAREKQINRPMHQGLLRTPQIMNNIQVYNLNNGKEYPLPSLAKARRFSLILFYMNGCIPSRIHLDYFSIYASSHPAQNTYISINCTHDKIDDLKELTKDLNDIECYTELSPENSEDGRNEKRVHELLSLDGVPTYFVLDYSGRIVWKGRFCSHNQLEYNSAMDHIVAEVNQLRCTKDNCDICRYRSIDDSRIKLEIDEVAKKLQSITQQRIIQSRVKQQEEEKQNRTRQVVSMKKRASRINANENG